MKYLNNNKIDKLNLNKDNTYIVMDFDKTITSYDSSDSWDAVANPKFVEPGIRSDMDRLYKKYNIVSVLKRILFIKNIRYFILHFYLYHNHKHLQK